MNKKWLKEMKEEKAKKEREIEELNFEIVERQEIIESLERKGKEIERKKKIKKDLFLLGRHTKEMQNTLDEIEK